MLRQGQALEAAAPRACGGLKREDDGRLALAIAGEVLRRLPDYDALIDSVTQRNLPHDAKARMVLRMALAQAFSLRIPPHAAISTALPLLAGGPRRLAHGVFGALMRREARLPEIPTLPDAVAARWRENWGAEAAEAAARAIAEPPPLDLTLADAAKTGEWAERLGGKSLLPGHVRRERAAIAELAGYEGGDWWVQDIAASLPARLFGAGEGRRALDLCAAPGGKTMQLAAQGWLVTAVDRAESRLARLSDNLARTGLSAELIAADALEWDPGARFDAILLDAPCSATGIFRRHPDVLYRATPRIIAECAEIQAAMLDRASAWLAPGGGLVYAVCSLEPEEGEAVAATFLDRHAGFAAIPPDPALLPEGMAPDARDFLRVLPGRIADPGGADGFFIAQFRHS